MKLRQWGKFVGITAVLCAAFAAAQAANVEPLVGAPVKRFGLAKPDVQLAATPAAPALVAAPETPYPAAPSTHTPPSVKTWTILTTDGRLANTLERWAQAEGMKLVWDAQQHVMLSSGDSFRGTLTEALQRVLASPAIRQSSYPLEACVYPNSPPVLRITRLGEQATECPQ